MHNIIGFLLGFLLGTFFREARSQVVRATRLSCRKAPEGLEIELGLGNPKTDKHSLSTQKYGSKWVPVSNQGNIRHQNERDDLHLPYVAKDTVNL